MGLCVCGVCVCEGGSVCGFGVCVGGECVCVGLCGLCGG